MNGTNRSSGLLEAYSFNGWIPICFFENFTAHMADAACRQLGYPYQLSYQSTNTSSVSGIAITSQSCTSSDNELFDCVTGGIDYCAETSMLTCDGKNCFTEKCTTDCMHTFLCYCLYMYYGVNTLQS